MRLTALLLADYDPGTLTGFFVFLIGVLATFVCAVGAVASLLMRKWQAVRKWLLAAGISAVAAIGLWYATVLVGKLFDWL